MADFWNCIHTIGLIQNLLNIKIMIFNKQKEEYIAPSVMVVDVICEAGFKASSGELTFVDGVDDGWYGL